MYLDIFILLLYVVIYVDIYIYFIKNNFIKKSFINFLNEYIYIYIILI